MQVKGDVVIQWVPGHMDIPGNEAADMAAKEAAAITEEPSRPVSLAGALSCVNRSIHDTPIEHLRTALVYKKINLAKDRAEVKSRKDAVFLAQVRSGHCLSFKAYHHLGYLTQQLTPCVQDAVMVRTLWNTGFWSALGPSQQEETSPPLEVLTDHPGKAVLMSRRTL